jgi:hypothetical protein
MDSASVIIWSFIWNAGDGFSLSNAGKLYVENKQ